MEMAIYLERPALIARVRSALRANPVVALLGPRQCGKTTLARTVAAGAGAPTWSHPPR